MKLRENRLRTTFTSYFIPQIQKNFQNWGSIKENFKLETLTVLQPAEEEFTLINDGPNSPEIETDTEQEIIDLRTIIVADYLLNSGPPLFLSMNKFLN